jgi:hypothetical protein
MFPEALGTFLGYATSLTFWIQSLIVLGACAALAHVVSSLYLRMHGVRGEEDVAGTVAAPDPEHTAEARAQMQQKLNEQVSRVR